MKDLKNEVYPHIDTISKDEMRGLLVEIYNEHGRGDNWDDFEAYVKHVASDDFYVHQFLAAEYLETRNQPQVRKLRALIYHLKSELIRRGAFDSEDNALPPIDLLRKYSSQSFKIHMAVRTLDLTLELLNDWFLNNQD